MSATATKAKTGNTEKVILKEEVEVARQDLARAEARLRSLTHELASIPDRMREALAAAAKERADKARQGESAAFAEADLDVEELRQRKGAAALELWATQIAVQEARLALYAAEEELEKARKAEAEERLEKIKPCYEALRQEYEAAKGAANLDGFNLHRAHLKQEARAKLAELEASYPGGLDA